MWKRWLLAIAAALLTVEIALCVAAWYAMCQPPAVFGRIVASTPMPLMLAVPFETLWTKARAGSLRVGDPAPDFRLPALDHSSSVQLSSFRGERPVVLVFGSYT
jgi:hypothetical protein